MQDQIRTFGIVRLAERMGVSTGTVQAWLDRNRSVPAARHQEVLEAMRAEIASLQSALQQAERFVARGSPPK